VLLHQRVVLRHGDREQLQDAAGEQGVDGRVEGSQGLVHFRRQPRDGLGVRPA
jgi:hypothetical protein